jgi:hypothetical protein
MYIDDRLLTELTIAGCKAAACGISQMGFSHRPKLKRAYALVKSWFRRSSFIPFFCLFLAMFFSVSDAAVAENPLYPREKAKQPVAKISVS